VASVVGQGRQYYNAKLIMTDSGPNAGPGRIGLGFDVKPHAYDPVANPELFEGVLARRVVAFVIDVVIIAMSPGSVIWALLYYGVTLGGPASATIGMRAMEIEMRTWYGAPAYFVLGAVHAIVFWISISVLTPFIILVGFFNARRRLLHDILVGTVLINNPSRAASLRAHAPR
jgi:uncharacterized RDD family membrane protein YckC